jgi:hypothetical protein
LMQRPRARRSSPLRGFSSDDQKTSDPPPNPPGGRESGLGLPVPDSAGNGSRGFPFGGRLVSWPAGPSPHAQCIKSGQARSVCFNFGAGPCQEATRRLGRPLSKYRRLRSGAVAASCPGAAPAPALWPGHSATRGQVQTGQASFNVALIIPGFCGAMNPPRWLASVAQLVTQLACQ